MLYSVMFIYVFLIYLCDFFFFYRNEMLEYFQQHKLMRI